MLPRLHGGRTRFEGTPQRVDYIQATRALLARDGGAPLGPLARTPFPV